MSRDNPFYVEDFWKKFKRVSESVIFSGCGFSKDITACIEKQIEGGVKYRTAQLKKAKSGKEREEIKRKILNLIELLNEDFAMRVETEYWLNSHPIYREKLGYYKDIKYDIKDFKFYKKKKK